MVTDAKSQDPDAKSQDPDAKSQDPDAKSQDPDAKSQETKSDSDLYNDIKRLVESVMIPDDIMKDLYELMLFH
jgi:hypothetical protein